MITIILVFLAGIFIGVVLGVVGAAWYLNKKIQESMMGTVGESMDLLQEMTEKPEEKENGDDSGA